MKITYSDKSISYPEALAFMEQCVAKMQPGGSEQSPVHLWFLEHPSLYTAGSSAQEKDLIATDNIIPVYNTGRGGQYTYHGPGQLIVYCMANLRVIDLDIRAYVKTLEHWIVRVLNYYGIQGFLDPHRIGVWVINPITKQEEKIAAIGVRVSRGVTSHGLSFNWAPELSHFKGIIPCGLSNYGVTSLQALGIHTTFKDVMCAFQATMPEQFLKNNTITHL